jgi:hypothetical protein
MATQKVWGFVFKGRFATMAYVDANGVIRNTFDVKLKNVVADPWKTRRAITSIIGDTKLTIRLSNIVVENVDGSISDAGEAIKSATGLNAQVFTLEQMIKRSPAFKGDAAAAEALWKKVQKVYAVEIAAQVAQAA